MAVHHTRFDTYGRFSIASQLTGKPENPEEPVGTKMWNSAQTVTRAQYNHPYDDTDIPKEEQ